MRATIITIPIGGSNKSPFVPRVFFRSIFFCLCYYSVRCTLKKTFCFFFQFRVLAHQDLCFWSQVSPLMPFPISWVEWTNFHYLHHFTKLHHLVLFCLLLLPFSCNFKSNFDFIVLGKLPCKVSKLQVEVEIWMHLFYWLLCVLVLRFLCKHIWMHLSCLLLFFWWWVSCENTFWAIFLLLLCFNNSSFLLQLVCLDS